MVDVEKFEKVKQKLERTGAKVHLHAYFDKASYVVSLTLHAIWPNGREWEVVEVI